MKGSTLPQQPGGLPAVPLDAVEISRATIRQIHERQAVELPGAVLYFGGVEPVEGFDRIPDGFTGHSRYEAGNHHNRAIGASRFLAYGAGIITCAARAVLGR